MKIKSKIYKQNCPQFLLNVNATALKQQMSKFNPQSSTMCRQAYASCYICDRPMTPKMLGVKFRPVSVSASNYPYLHRTPN